MVVKGNRVRCANCGMIYDKPPTEQVFWIGVPYRVEGVEYCPKCGSNATDPILKQLEWMPGNSSDLCFDVRYFVPETTG